jgi:lysophospholipase L1-like esterase
MKTCRSHRVRGAAFAAAIALAMAAISCTPPGTSPAPSKGPGPAVAPATKPATPATTATRPTGFAVWEKDIRAFEERDRKAPPPKGQIVFVGSSSIRAWDTKKYFPSLVTIQRGFGGSQVADSTHFADRIVIPYAPRVVVFYAGNNDIASGKAPQRVLEDTQAFVRKIHAALPKTRIVYIAIKPSIDRWKLIEKIRQANSLIEAFTRTDPLVAFVDVDKPMIGPDGLPRKELLAQDNLHLSHEGYVLWSSLVLPHLGDQTEKK